MNTRPLLRIAIFALLSSASVSGQPFNPDEWYTTTRIWNPDGNSGAGAMEYTFASADWIAGGLAFSDHPTAAGQHVYGVTEIYGNGIMPLDTSWNVVFRTSIPRYGNDRLQPGECLQPEVDFWINHIVDGNFSDHVFQAGVGLFTINARTAGGQADYTVSGLSSWEYTPTFSHTAYAVYASDLVAHEADAPLNDVYGDHDLTTAYNLAPGGNLIVDIAFSYDVTSHIYAQYFRVPEVSGNWLPLSSANLATDLSADVLHPSGSDTYDVPIQFDIFQDGAPPDGIAPDVSSGELMFTGFSMEVGSPGPFAAVPEASSFGWVAASALILAIIRRATRRQ